jgi:hypothetical protein
MVCYGRQHADIANLGIMSASSCEMDSKLDISTTSLGIPISVLMRLMVEVICTSHCVYIILNLILALLKAF